MSCLLLLELVPSTCWESNVRALVTPAQWDVCKRWAAQQSASRCRVCAGRGRRWPVECHEIWRYDQATATQVLIGLEALCPACHEVRHLGRAMATGNGPRALRHLARVNGWSLQDAELYVEAAFEQWALRSQQTWALDCSWLGQLGLPSLVFDAQSRPGAPGRPRSGQDR